MFLNEVERGLEGKNAGLYCGLPQLNRFINSIQKKTYYLVGGATKAAKTALIDEMFVLSPYLVDVKKKGKQVNWIYYSYEIDLINKMAKYCAYFMDLKYGIYCDSNYILSRGDQRLKEEHVQYVRDIYNNELTDLFGEYDNNKRLIKPGRIKFFEEKMNPEGIRRFLMAYAEQNGEWVKEKIVIKGDDGAPKEIEIITGYREKNDDLTTIIIVDHISIAKREKGFTKKENIDKISEHMVFFRNICKFTPVMVSQFNRELGKIERLKFSGEQLQPTLEDFKESGDPAQDANVVIALFNPTIYPHLRMHLGYDLTRLGRSYRSIHILASRDTEANVSLSVLCEGKTGHFVELPDAKDNVNLIKAYDYVAKFD